MKYFWTLIPIALIIVVILLIANYIKTEENTKKGLTKPVVIQAII